jgi:hypothetical protein
LLPLAALAALAGCSGPAPYGATCASVPPIWNEPDNFVREWDTGKDKVFIDKTGIYWNALPVSLATLREYLGIASKQPVYTPIVLHIEPNAECDMVRKVLAEMKRAPICEEHCGTLKRWPDPPPPPGY